MKSNDLWEVIAKDQYTGLDDKHGIEIYENHIVKWTSRFPGAKGDEHIDVMEWDATGACFMLKPWIHEPYAAEMEVLGDIHSTPELLK